MRFNPLSRIQRLRPGLILAATGAFLAALTPACWSADRYVTMRAPTGQIYHAIASGDLPEMGLSIPRGAVLPRRMFPVRSFGMPSSIRIYRPEWTGLLLAHPGLSHSNYLNRNPSDYLPPRPGPAVFGTVTVQVLPPSVTWSLKDTYDNVYSGTGNQTLPHVPAGPVSLTWNLLAGYDAPLPNPALQTLKPDGVVVFFEIYVPQSPVAARRKVQVLRYLLGLTANYTGLDLNGDGRVNVVDLVKGVNALPSLPSAKLSSADSKAGAPSP